ncbi:3-phosphoshikimate 1-carboxyvinyltransferase [Spirochaetia bacterium]|nr:3-phosphoshikimate 1-carboxyvinyltransferase [Spirochaetia bacterium]
MYARISPHQFSGTFRIPASKSHTIRRLLMAALAEGVSEIGYPLDSLDARSCVAFCRALGAVVEEHRGRDDQCANPADANGEKLLRWTVTGIAGRRALAGSTLPIDVGNSGTTLFLALGIAALGTGDITLTGDEQLRRRSAAPLLEALAHLGATVRSGPGGCAPVTIRGPWKGGKVSISCPTSQYLSSLLLAAPLAAAGIVTEIETPLLNEKPYIEMTLSYLDAQHILYEKAADLSWFRIPGGASYRPLNGSVPGDFSSAAFPGCAAAIGSLATGSLTGGATLLGLDPDDTQGDKVFFDILGKMGCTVRWEKLPVKEAAAEEWALVLSRTGPLHGGEFDLNATPDMLPALAAVACYAEGDTALVNVAHARIKETDRIAVMAAELGTLGCIVEERPDGLIIHGNGGRGIRGGVTVQGHGDHRVVMALAAAALGANGPVTIDTAEVAAVTYPGFLELLGAQIIE